MYQPAGLCSWIKSLSSGTVGRRERRLRKRTQARSHFPRQTVRSRRVAFNMRSFIYQLHHDWLTSPSWRCITVIWQDMDTCSSSDFVPIGSCSQKSLLIHLHKSASNWPRRASPVRARAINASHIRMRIESCDLEQGSSTMQKPLRRDYDYMQIYWPLVTNKIVLVFLKLW